VTEYGPALRPVTDSRSFVSGHGPGATSCQRPRICLRSRPHGNPCPGQKGTLALRYSQMGRLMAHISESLQVLGGLLRRSPSRQAYGTKSILWVTKRVTYHSIVPRLSLFGIISIRKGPVSLLFGSPFLCLFVGSASTSVRLDFQ
jgi:hypothetical protein